MSVYTADHDALRETVRSLLDRAADHEAVRATIDGPHAFDEQLWRRMSDELGLAGLAVPEGHGGAGYGVIELSVVLEELGRAAVPSPLLSTTLAGIALASSGVPDTLDDTLRCLAAGAVQGTVVFDDTSELDVRDGAASGMLRHVLDGPTADVVVVVSPAGSVVVETNSPGVSVRALDTMDLTRGQAILTLDRAPVHALDTGPGWADRLRATAGVLLASEQLGGAERMLAMSTSYAGERVQFGRAVGSFQAVKHTLADMLVDLELARVIHQRALRALAQGSTEDCAAAALACGRAFTALTSEAVRVHAGIGFTWEHDIHLHFRRARASARLFGGPGAWTERAADDVLAGPVPSADTDDEPDDVTDFRRRVADWFSEHGVPKGSAPSRAHADADYVSAARAHQAALSAAGLAGITWPTEYGGLGLGPTHVRAFEQATEGYETFADIFTIGLGMCGPVLLALGTEEQKRRYLPPMLRGEELWCQLFSEPGAGSDLAALSATGRRDGDEWVVAGQKVWTTFAHHSDFGLLLVRTDPDAPKHRGITMLIADMGAPGIDVRPLRQMTGDREFNEVFLDDVRIPADHLVGAVDAGWKGAGLMLMNERLALSNSPISSPVTMQAVANEIQRRGLGTDPIVRRDLAHVHVAERGVELFAERLAEDVEVGNDPGPFASIGKVASGRHAKLLAALAMDIADADAVAWDPHDVNGGLWAYGELFAPSLSIAGGTDNIQRNILGERVLGLPREPSVAPSDTPFRDLPRS